MRSRTLFTSLQVSRALGQAPKVKLTRAISTGSNTLHGRSAIITGGSRGIGYAIAQKFANEGVKCLLIGRQSQTLKEARKGLLKSSKGAVEHNDVSYVRADMSDRNTWTNIFRDDKTATASDDSDNAGGVAWLQRHPHPDILVNAAGISQNSLFLRSSMDQLEAVVQTNLLGTMTACREVGKKMATSKGTRNHSACIINVSSLLGLQGGRGATAYAASKAGILAFTRALAAEMGPLNVRVNVIVPGYVETEMTSGMTTSAKEELVKKIPIGRFARPEEVADAAAFLALNEYANNCVMNLDGGLSAFG